MESSTGLVSFFRVLTAGFLESLDSGESTGVSGNLGLGDFLAAGLEMTVDFVLGDFLAGDLSTFLVGDLEGTFLAGSLTTILDLTSGSDSSLLLITYLCFL